MLGPRFIGRFDASDPANVKFSWSLSAIEARFMGAEVSVELSGPENFFQVSIDSQIKTLQAGTGTFVLGKDLGAGPHTLRFSRRNESFDGVTLFKGFSVPAADYLPTPVPDRRLEILGDSITAGYGNEGCPRKDKTNAELTYGALTARAVSADLHIIAQSGAGAAKSLGNAKTLPEFYENTLGDNSGQKWDFSKYQPNAVVINLGTNDRNTGASPDDFKTKFGALLKLLRGHYPQALIYGVSQDGAMKDELQASVAAAADAKIKFLAIDGNNGKGCDGHPDLAGHAKMSETLTATLKADLGW